MPVIAWQSSRLIIILNFDDQILEIRWVDIFCLQVGVHITVVGQLAEDILIDGNVAISIMVCLQMTELCGNNRTSHAELGFHGCRPEATAEIQESLAKNKLTERPQCLTSYFTIKVNPQPCVCQECTKDNAFRVGNPQLPALWSEADELDPGEPPKQRRSAG
ncbi:hypothetical protein E4U14_006721 [Claviceps sp. LM454 group G7]|nr:hypothetical protein E4U14_006721 [Claviceps sp. LM454 group G7]